MSEQPEQVWRQPDRGLLRLRRVMALADLGGTGSVVALAVGILVGWQLGLAVIVLTAALTGLTLRVVQRQWAAWGYLEREDDLMVRHGLLVRRTSVVPYGRMQYVDVTAGPLERRFGLATLTMHTAAAATDASVPGLLAEEAARLRDRLAALGEARQAGV